MPIVIGVLCFVGLLMFFDYKTSKKQNLKKQEGHRLYCKTITVKDIYSMILEDCSTNNTFATKQHIGRYFKVQGVIDFIIEAKIGQSDYVLIRLDTSTKPHINAAFSLGGDTFATITRKFIGPFGKGDKISFIGELNIESKKPVGIRLDYCHSLTKL